MATRQIHISLEDPAEAEYQVQQRLGVTLHVLLRTLLRMYMAGEVIVSRDDVRRHQGRKAGNGAS